MSHISDEQHSDESLAPSDTADVIFVPDAPSGLPVYFGGNVRAEVVHADDASLNDEDPHNGTPHSESNPMSVTTADPDRVLSTAVSAPEDAIAALRQSQNFGIYKERLDVARRAVRDGIRKASHPDVLHSLNWDMQQLDKVAALPELGQLAAWLWARLVFGRGFAILAILTVLAGIGWSTWIVVSNR